MSKTAFYGTISASNGAMVEQLLSDWLKTNSLGIKVKMTGWEATYQDASTYLYCHEDFSGNLFLLEGETRNSLEETVRSLELLRGLCQTRAVAGRFECLVVDDDGNASGELTYVT